MALVHGKSDLSTLESPVRAEDGSFIVVLRNTAAAVGKYPLTFLGVWCVNLILGGLLLSAFPKSYTASAIICPPAELGRFSAQSALGGAGLGALSSLAGVPQTAEQSRYEAFSTLLTSRRVAEVLIAKHDVLPQLLKKSYDFDKKAWKRPKGFIADLHQKFLTFMGFPPWSPPDSTTLEKYLFAHIAIGQSARSQQKTVTMRGRDPVLVRDLLRWDIEEADNIVRADSQMRSIAQLNLLRREMSETITNAEDRSVLTELLLSTERSVLLASTNASFAVEVVQPPELNKQPTSPPLAPAMALIFVFGGAIAAWCAVLRVRRKIGKRVS